LNARHALCHKATINGPALRAVRTGVRTLHE
jgi:hypothetical protein